ncbi:D-aminoacylase [Lachnospiraceae bacterium 54-53]
MFDIIILNASVIDGTGKEPYSADIGITGDRIREVGDLTGAEAGEIIDAKGMTVAPGFIDLHTHSDLSFLYDRRTSNRIYNGVTTDVCGNCGVGVAPVSDKYSDDLLGYLKTRIIGNIPCEIELKWRTYKEYLNAVNEVHTAVNVAPILAQGVIHIYEKGLSQSETTEEELEVMKKQVREAMECGAVGMSSGLIYLPGAYTSSHEFTELCKAMKEYGGVYFTHKRDEGDRLYEAIDEAAGVALSAGVPLHISHLKVTGKKNFGTVKKVFSYIRELQASGLKITYDTYPYSWGMTSLLALLPPWVSEGGIDRLVERLKSPQMREKVIYDIENGVPGWSDLIKNIQDFSRIVIASSKVEANLWMEGKNLQEIAAQTGKDVYTLILDLIVEEKARTLIIAGMMDEDDVAEILSDPDTMIGSDSMTCGEDGLLAAGKPHPRTFGTQARVLAEYCRERKLFPLETAVKKMTSMPAKLLGLKDRGEIKPGYYADLCMFDLAEVQDMATYQDPIRYSKGMEYVFVNGQVALRNGKQTEVYAGRVITREKSGK